MYNNFGTLFINVPSNFGDISYVIRDRGITRRSRCQFEETLKCAEDDILSC